ncbi:MAG: hypothetical protein JRF43_02140 [Deltaproteobacteria bacterium]|nr:hypothetical protein [Deltaproteobacteria bacterium]
MADLVLTTSVLEETKIQIENTDLILVTIFGENVFGQVKSGTIGKNHRKDIWPK